MKTTSAQVSAFVVLVAAILGVGYFTNREEFKTEVKTLNETLLPLNYTGADQTDVLGFNINYPYGWAVASEGGGVFTVTRPIDTVNPRGEKYEITLALSEQTAETPIDPATVFPDGSSVEVLPAEVSPYPAARVVTETEGSISFQEAVRLRDDNTFLVVRGENIAADDWNDIRDELDQMIASITLGDDFALVPDVYTFTVPANWELYLDQKTVFGLRIPVGADQATMQAQAQWGVMPAAEMIPILADIFQNLIPTADLTSITDPLEAMRLLEGLETPPEGITVVQPLTEVTYFGLNGLQFGYTQGNFQVSLAVLDNADGYHTIVIKFILDIPNAATYLADMDTMLQNGSYTTPNPIIFEQTQ